MPGVKPERWEQRRHPLPVLGFLFSIIIIIIILTIIKKKSILVLCNYGKTFARITPVPFPGSRSCGPTPVGHPLGLGDDDLWPSALLLPGMLCNQPGTGRSTWWGKQHLGFTHGDTRQDTGRCLRRTQWELGEHLLSHLQSIVIFWPHVLLSLLPLAPPSLDIWGTGWRGDMIRMSAQEKERRGVFHSQSVIQIQSVIRLASWRPFTSAPVHENKD